MGALLNLVCKTLVAKTASLPRDLGSLEDPWNQSWCKLIPTRILYQHVPTLIYIENIILKLCC
jgi:hypothetical protein